MIVFQNNQVFSDQGKYIHRLGTETYFKRSMLLPSDTQANFEEVDEPPKYSAQEYKEKVAELIAQRYSLADELGIERQKETKPSEWQEHYDFCEECKIKAKEILNSQADNINSLNN